MNKLPAFAVLAVAAIAEAATGVALIVAPSLVTRLLFGAELVGSGEVLGRISGMALLSLGIACWPDPQRRLALPGMASYSLLATGYLAYLGVQGAMAGPLLWPAVALHAVVTLLLARALMSQTTT